MSSRSLAASTSAWRKPSGASGSTRSSLPTPASWWSIRPSGSRGRRATRSMRTAWPTSSVSARSARRSSRRRPGSGSYANVPGSTGPWRRMSGGPRTASTACIGVGVSRSNCRRSTIRRGATAGCASSRHRCVLARSFSGASSTASRSSRPRPTGRCSARLDATGSRGFSARCRAWGPCGCRS